MTYFDNALKLSDGKTLVLVNGSSGSPEPVESLLDLLCSHTLDPINEKYHCYCGHAFSPAAQARSIVKKWRRATVFSGNFLNLSHAYNIVTRDQRTIERLKAAQSANLRRSDYQKRAFELYSDWFYAKAAGGDTFLIPGSTAKQLQSGGYKALTGYHTYSESLLLKSATVLRPRFSRSDTLRLAS